MGKTEITAFIEDYLLSKKGSYKDFPFGPEAAVFKVCDKMFALISMEKDIPRLNLKCDPEDAELLRSMFGAVKPGYHMNKRHWNSVYIDGSVPDGIIYQMIDDSYELVVKRLKKTDRLKLKEMEVSK
ncbi:MmcQ/YjbR family DNA-binding protein [Thermodesulfobacteriota bacterium]